MSNWNSEDAAANAGIPKLSQPHEPKATSYPGASPAESTGPNVSRDPMTLVRMTVPVNHSAGDSPIVRTPGYRFTSLDPYARPEGLSPNPVTPQEASKG